MCDNCNEKAKQSASNYLYAAEMKAKAQAQECFIGGQQYNNPLAGGPLSGPNVLHILLKKRTEHLDKVDHLNKLINAIQENETVRIILDISKEVTNV